MSIDRPRTARLLAVVFTISSFATSFGCGKSSDSTSPGGGGGGGSTSTFVGTMAGPTVGGKLTLSVPTTSPAPADARAAIAATGTFAPTGGAAIGLSGTYDPTTKALSVTGGGYTITGTYFSGVLKGSWTRSPATAAGTFISVLATSASSVRVYCGTFTSTSGGVGGIFDFALQGATIDGVAYTSDGTEIPLQGTLGGATTITIVNSQNPGPFLATGTLNTANNTVSGTYDDGAGNSGNWSGVGV